MSEYVLKMRTAWGRKHGWELERVYIGAHAAKYLHWRKIWRAGGIAGANTEEIAMWRALPREMTSPKRSTRHG